MIGFIGYGNMGGALVRAFLSHGIPADEIVISTRSPEKLKSLLDEYSVSVGSMNEVQSADILFLCVRSSDALDVLKQLTSFKGHLVSINGGISLNDLSSIYSGPVTKAMPPLTAEVGRGIVLLCHNQICSTSKIIEELFSKVCSVEILPEDKFPDAENITGCAPAFFARFAEMLAESSNFSSEESLKMAKETLIATALLLDEGKLSLNDLIEKVATKGGITEKGLQVMDDELPSTVKKMYEHMH
ncbi:pyrroline-5-carboxylate reductase family protein [Candidatus Methanomassiliicoccus intestinalis]|jgi:pyrroline-5-carboxylate reductase|uniref:Pyrroline-5-carboxylate reductase n=2 Tax=Candidatus Methanomassiliicoccus intestinalis TaxID=1406512 RepID=R9T9N1_METII|nr:NAD(P)-binding domain-containing protein [Candidatus Methanomassiliicoccus intestinalis]AGN26083.1 pyrroline-5-carboxylate reductase [Candidatus Methanomassiliicoccus intestinalis Issoire-Mx1]TQS82208.1 MAG: hypothetical protein A3206_00615 [Candidatus Methanomassiliicoccus intestinalis]TQS84826.1 MAG: hypothetical protein A3207_02030 [Candidatus Methanomassiliicoccus intestinalis]